MSDLLGRIKRLERKILPRYRACFNRWERLIAKHEKATALQQRDPATWNGDEQFFMTHWQFYLDRHPKLAQRLHNLPPAQHPSTAPAKAEGEERQGIGNREQGTEQSKIQNPISNMQAEGKEDPALNRSDSAKSTHLPANPQTKTSSPPPSSRAEKPRKQSKIQNPKPKIETPYTYERDERGCWIKVPIVPTPPPSTNASNSPLSAHPAATSSPLPPNLGGRGGGEGPRTAYAVSRGAKAVPSVKLDVGADRPIHSNVVLRNLDED